MISCVGLVCVPKTLKKYVGFQVTLNTFLFLFLQSVIVFQFVLCCKSSAVELNIWALTAGIKKYKSIIQKKRKKHHTIAFLAKTNLILFIFLFLFLPNTDISKY